MNGRQGVVSNVTLLSGGVGGAKLALGLSRVLAPENLTIIANTGDDFVHLGLKVSPDIDTLTYTLAGIVDPDKGWGRRAETWTFMEALGELGGETWFRLGDRDLALHVERSRRLAGGESLSEVTRALCARLGVRNVIVPMSDDAVSTRVHTRAGELAFQDYFVRRRAAPTVAAVRFAGAGEARPAPGVTAALAGAGVILIAPSNPFLSIDPILAVSGVRAALAGTAANVVAISPIVAGRALKGPTAKIMTELGLPPSPVAIAHHYGGVLDGLVIDEQDSRYRQEIGSLGLAVAVTQTVMQSEDDKVALARFTLQFAESLAIAGNSGNPGQTKTQT
jgi:LPPG:FO 2-phospho-L-lactate transferase